MFPHLSVAGYVVKADLLTRSPQENLPDVPTVNCTSVYKENSFNETWEQSSGEDYALGKTLSSWVLIALIVTGDGTVSILHWDTGVNLTITLMKPNTFKRSQF